MPLFKCTSSKSTPRKAISYITDPNKAEFVSVRNLFEDEDYASQFNETTKRFGKCKGYDERKYYHIKLSCARKDNVSPQAAQKYAEEMAALLFYNHECVIATHTDTKTVHSHIIVNAVDSITGKKLHINSDEYGRMKDEANRIGKRYGFSELNWRKGAKHRRTSEEKHIILKGGTSWKEELREVIQEGITVSRSEKEFITYLQTNYGVEITRNGKDFSYLHPQKKKAIRGERLGTNYTKSEVLKRIGEQNYRQTTTADYRREEEIFTNNPELIRLDSAVDELKAVTQGGLFQKALALSNEKCNNLIRQQTLLIEDLTRQVKNVKESNYENVRNLTDKVESVTRRLETLINQQATMKAETVQEVQRVADNVIKEGIDLFSAKVSETTEEVKDKLKDVENEIEQAKSDIHFERGFRKFLFWATPILLAFQTAISIFLLLR